jgi:hypothetical protein
VLLFLIYYLIYDLVYYWMHRMQHSVRGGGPCTACTTASEQVLLDE